MKKIATILLALALWGVSKPPCAMAATNHIPPTIIHEATLVNVLRDIELLDSWLVDKGYSKETADALRCQSYQKILALYEVDQQAFKESLKYYLEDSLERALKIYAKVYTALEALST